MHLGHLGLGDLVRILTADANAVPVNLQHCMGRLSGTLEEDSFQDGNDEVHRGVVVVMHEDEKRGRSIEFGRELGVDLPKRIVMHGLCRVEDSRAPNMGSIGQRGGFGALQWEACSDLLKLTAPL